MRAVLIPMLLALGVGGCVTTGPASVKGGECRVFQAPAQQVHGVAVYDQVVINDYIESGVAGCGWKRPAARARPVIVTNTQTGKPVTVKKKRWWRRKSTS